MMGVSFFPGLAPPNGIVDCLCGWCLTWWFWCDDWESGWWVYHTWSKEHGLMCHQFTTFHLNQGVRIIPFLTKQLQTLNKAWILSSPIQWRYQNWTHHLMSLMSLLLQSLLGFFVHSVLFLILLNFSLLLASALINYGVRLRHFLPLCLWPPRCQHLSWLNIFLATQQYLVFNLQHHQITSSWILPIGRLIRVFWNFRLALVELLMPL